MRKTSIFIICFALSILCFSNVSMSEEANITVHVLKPTANSTFNVGEVIEFSGKGVAPDGFEIKDNSLEWFSDKDGELGKGPVIFKSLSSGAHVISLIIKDSSGVSIQAQVSIVVEN